MNICANCKHYESRGTAWYDLFCMHPSAEHKQEVNPQTGKLGYARGQQWPYARDINPKGECGLYEEKTR